MPTQVLWRRQVQRGGRPRDRVHRAGGPDREVREAQRDGHQDRQQDVRPRRPREEAQPRGREWMSHVTQS